MHVRGRVLGASGQPAGDEFGVAIVDGRATLTPAVACAPDGSFAVAFSVFDAQMEPAGIRLQRFDARGQRIGDEVCVSADGMPSSIEPVIAATPTGYVVAWLDGASDGDDYGVLARRFGHDGRALGAPFVVNSTTAGMQNAAAIAVARDGGFAIAWNSADGDQTGIFAQRFDTHGRRLGGEFRINDYTTGHQALEAATGTQRLAFGRDGQLLCAWSGDAGTNDKHSANVTLLTPRPLSPLNICRGVTDEMPSAGVVLAAGGPEPHRPPTFDPTRIDRGEREIRLDGRFGFDAVLNTGWNPPDPHMGVGPDHIVVMTNGAISFFTKDGTQTFTDEIEDSYGFWGSVGATGFVFDPEVLYDELSGRWFAMAAEAYAPPGQTKSYVLIAVSDDSDPNGTWYKYRFDTSTLNGNLFDSPNIAVDNDVVYITGDGFGSGAVYSVYTFDKASLLVGNPPAIQKSLTMATSTQSAGIPPVSFDSPPALYMCEHAEGNNRNTVRLVALRDPLGTPFFTFYTLTVPTYSAPGLPSQKGTTMKPTTFDARFWSVAYRNGSLWATHHINANPVRARWYQIAMNGWPTSGNNPTLVQSGTFGPGISTHTYFSAIGVDALGNAALTCARSSTTEYISMVTAHRYADAAAGTMSAGVIEKSSNAPFQSDRWGDYAAVAADPMDLHVLWAHHEYSLNGSWRTWVAKVFLPRGDLNCDGSVDFADINPFVLAISDPAGYAATYPTCPLENRDINGDGACDFLDINPFVALLTSL